MSGAAYLKLPPVPGSGSIGTRGATGAPGRKTKEGRPTLENKEKINGSIP